MSCRKIGQYIISERSWHKMHAAACYLGASLILSNRFKNCKINWSSLQKKKQKKNEMSCPYFDVVRTDSHMASLVMLEQLYFYFNAHYALSRHHNRDIDPNQNPERVKGNFSTGLKASNDWARLTCSGVIPQFWNSDSKGSVTLLYLFFLHISALLQFKECLRRYAGWKKEDEKTKTN